MKLETIIQRKGFLSPLLWRTVSVFTVWCTPFVTLYMSNCEMMNAILSLASWLVLSFMFFFPKTGLSLKNCIEEYPHVFIHLSCEAIGWERTIERLLTRQSLCMITAAHNRISASAWQLWNLCFLANSSAAVTLWDMQISFLPLFSPDNFDHWGRGWEGDP